MGHMVRAAGQEKCSANGRKITVEWWKDFYVSSDTDIIHAIKECMGDEFGDAIKAFIKNLDRKSDAGELGNTLIDTREQLEKWQKNLEGRVTKAKMIREMEDLKTKIDSVL